MYPYVSTESHWKKMTSQGKYIYNVPYIYTHRIEFYSIYNRDGGIGIVYN